MSPILDTKGNIIAIRWLINDVTRQTQANQDLHTAKEELESRIASRNHELKDANERMQIEIKDREEATDKLTGYTE